MDKYTSHLKLFSFNANWDETKVLYVPIDCDFEVPPKKWSGFVAGTYQYSGAKRWTRDYRIKVILRKTEKPFLYGRMFCKDFDDVNLLATHEENSQLFFGCKSWSDLLSDEFIKLFHNRSDQMRAQWTKLRQNGFTKDDFKFLYGENLILINPDTLIDFRNNGLIREFDLLDIARWLSDLGISTKEAKALYSSASTGKKISVLYGGQAFDYRSKTPKKNLHDFLEALISSCERKIEDINLQSSLPISNLNAPQGFAQVTTERELIIISRKNGWCSGQKFYRDGARRGEWMFFYDSENKVLAQYKTTGELMQVRNRHNAQFTGTIPNNLK